MTRFDDFDGLSLFVRIVDAGGLGAGERATGIPKATLSRRLTALEEQLNVRLVRRTKKGVLLTDQGRQLYERTRTAFSLAEEAVSEVQHERVALAGLCRLSLPPDLATAVLGPALIEFQTRHPAVKLDISLADRRVSLVEEGYDLVVRAGTIDDSGLMFRRLGEFPRMLVASPDFLRRSGPVSSQDDLSRVSTLAIRRDLAEWTLADKDHQHVQIRVQPAFSVNRQALLVEAALAGLGVANLPLFLIDHHLQEGTLVPVLRDWSLPPIVMTALWLKDRITARLVRAIVEAFEHAITHRAPNKPLTEIRCSTARDQDHGPHT